MRKKRFELQIRRLPEYHLLNFKEFISTPSLAYNELLSTIVEVINKYYCESNDKLYIDETTDYTYEKKGTMKSYTIVSATEVIKISLREIK
jgi:hypothetical protein